MKSVLNTAATVLIGLIAILHMFIAWLEMFAWETRGPRVFASLPAELFAQTTTMAANQGLYNAFLAAGLIWSLLIKDMHWRFNIAAFFLGCIAIAGIFGALTVSPTIAVVQTVPAVIALAAAYGAWRGSRSI